VISPTSDVQMLPRWRAFISEYNLSPMQSEQFQTYLKMLQEHNELINLTAITDTENIIASHFQDSLALSKFIDFNKLTMIADIGTGGGFPGIPLKIAFPHLRVVLIEVTKKKIEFLNTVINTLQLEGIEVRDMDWRTFIRKTDEQIDLFVSRASLHTDELMRMFKENCVYRTRQLVYWASQEWQLTLIEKPYFVKEVSYMIMQKTRRFIFFAHSPA
jgi:16S rRNA (guanine527-N7)-methyltransferase